MIVFGYAKDYYYTGDSCLQIRVRIPEIHGPYTRSEYKGNASGYTPDDDLPYYPSLILPNEPHDGDVVALASTNKSASQFIVLGLTGGSYGDGTDDDYISEV